MNIVYRGGAILCKGVELMNIMYRGGDKIQIIGAHVEEEEEEPQSLRPGVFKPKECTI